MINSRFSKFPNTDSNMDHQIVKWRAEDFNMKDNSQVEANNASKRHTVAGRGACYCCKLFLLEMTSCPVSRAVCSLQIGGCNVTEWSEREEVA